jgi:1A family penicillin-binding protein
LDEQELQVSRLLKKLGLKRRRGRPREKSAVLVRSRAFLEKKRRKIENRLKIFTAFWRPRWRRLLQWLGWRRRRGRPRKKVSRWWLPPTAKPFEPSAIIISSPQYLSRRDSFAFLSTLTILLMAWWGYQYIFADLPSIMDLTQKNPLLTTKILDRYGRVLFRIYEDENRTLVPLAEISQPMIQATLAIEDKNFYQHYGFSPLGILRAAWANFQGEQIEQGGSTITQQLVKNRLLTPERTWQRKLKELVLAVVAEGTYTKNQILEMYLNQVAYGGSTYGVEEAAWRYFHKSARDLNLAEAALLAGLPQAPSVYSPFGSNPELAFTRQEEVLRRLLEEGYITQEQWQEARHIPITFAEDRIDIQAPHFVMYVKRLLAQQFGEAAVQTGGLEVTTTLDLSLQKESEKILGQELLRLAPLNVGNGAVLVTNPKTGEILSMVGSRDYFDFAHDGQVNVVLRPRQPGSAIKPLTYALALEAGKTPATIIDDSPVVYQTVGSPPYAPKNYDGRFHGQVTLRTALASSYNVPAVKTLAELGVSAMLDRAAEAGITTWQDSSRFGLSLTLGSGEVTMLDMAKLYGTFANYGALVNPNPILEVKNYKGEVLYRNDCVQGAVPCAVDQVFSPPAAYLITDILADNRARTPAFGPQSVLHIPGYEVAVKTGTTNSLRDNWTIGYTTDRLVAVWVGNNDNTPMSQVASGITGASPIWNKTMRLLLNPQSPHVFAPLDNLVEVAICRTTGTLPCRECPAIRVETFIEGTQPTNVCSASYFVTQEATDERSTGQILGESQIQP